MMMMVYCIIFGNHSRYTFKESPTAPPPSTIRQKLILDSELAGSMHHVRKYNSDNCRDPTSALVQAPRHFC
jgi:hypothetical protein